MASNKQGNFLFSLDKKNELVTSTTNSIGSTVPFESSLNKRENEIEQAHKEEPAKIPKTLEQFILPKILQNFSPSLSKVKTHVKSYRLIVKERPVAKPPNSPIPNVSSTQTSNTNLNLSDKPIAPSKPFAASDKPISPRKPFVASDKPISPRKPFAPSDKPISPTSDKIIAPSKPFAASEKPIASSESYIASDEPNVPIKPFLTLPSQESILPLLPEEKKQSTIIIRTFFHQLAKALKHPKFNTFLEYIIFFKAHCTNKPINKLFSELSYYGLTEHQEVFEDIISSLFPQHIPPTEKTLSEEFSYIREFLQKLEECSKGVAEEFFKTLNQVCHFKSLANSKKSYCFKLTFPSHKDLEMVIYKLINRCFSCVSEQNIKETEPKSCKPEVEVMVQELNPFLMNNSEEKMLFEECNDSDPKGIYKDVSIGIYEDGPEISSSDDSLFKPSSDDATEKSPPRKRKPPIHHCSTCSPKRKYNHQPESKSADILPKQNKESEAQTNSFVGQFKHSCNRCNFSTPFLEDFLKHFPKHFLKGFKKCLECGLITNHQETFIKHQSTSKHRKSATTDIFNCDQCEFEINSKYLFIHHYIRHKKLKK